jgi:hypothetical protein
MHATSRAAPLASIVIHLSFRSMEMSLNLAMTDSCIGANGSENERNQEVMRE